MVRFSKTPCTHTTRTSTRVFQFNYYNQVETLVSLTFEMLNRRRKELTEVSFKAISSRNSGNSNDHTGSSGSGHSNVNTGSTDIANSNSNTGSSGSSGSNNVSGNNDDGSGSNSAGETSKRVIIKGGFNLIDDLELEQHRRYRRLHQRKRMLKMGINELNGIAVIERSIFKVKLDGIRELWHSFTSDYFEIVSNATDDDSLDQLNQDHAELQQQYQSISIRYESAQLTRTSNGGSSGDARLPRITITPFNGDYITWRPYRDLFNSLVHNNIHLSGIQKMHHLTTTLTGEPSMLLKHLPMVDGSYPVAWQLLNDRYENTKLLVNSQLQTILHQNSITTENPQAIKKLLDTTTECLHSLTNLGLDTTSWDPIINYIVVQKLPSDTRQRWEEGTNQRQLATWASLQKYLESRFQTLEAMGNIGTKVTPKSGHKATSQTSLTSQKQSTVCSMCNKAHPLYRYEAF